MTRRPWTPEALAEVCRRYPHERTADIAAFEAQERERLAAMEQEAPVQTTRRRAPQQSMPLE